MAVPIANILHQETIRRLSGDGAFERGKAYFLEGRVVDIQRKEGTVLAKVRGTETYDVRIWMKDESLAYACVCPQGQEQAFCKHAVAVALAFLGGLPAADPMKTDAANDDSAERRSGAKESPKPPAVRARPLEKADPKPPETRSPTPPASPATKPPSPSLAETLRALSHEELVVIALEAALDDPAFRDRLVRRLKA